MLFHLLFVYLFVCILFVCLFIGCCLGDGVFNMWTTAGNSYTCSVCVCVCVCVSL